MFHVKHKTVGTVPGVLLGGYKMFHVKHCACASDGSLAAVGQESQTVHGLRSGKKITPPHPATGCRASPLRKTNSFPGLASDRRAPSFLSFSKMPISPIPKSASKVRRTDLFTFPQVLDKTVGTVPGVLFLFFENVSRETLHL